MQNSYGYTVCSVVLRKSLILCRIPTAILFVLSCCFTPVPHTVHDWYCYTVCSVLLFYTGPSYCAWFILLYCQLFVLSCSFTQIPLTLQDSYCYTVCNVMLSFYNFIILWRIPTATLFVLSCCLTVLPHTMEDSYCYTVYHVILSYTTPSDYLGSLML